MNDDFSFDGAAAADMPLDLSSSSMPDMEPAQEQANVDSPKLADEWKEDVQMLDGGGLNGLEESAAPETGASLDAEATGEDGSEPFNPQLADTDSVRHQGVMLMKGMEERARKQARDKQDMIMSLLRADGNEQGALKRIAERWGEDSVSRLLAANDEDRSYMLGMRLAEVLGDGDSDVGFQIYKNTHNLWGKGIISPEQVWKDFAERGKEIVDREDRMREFREREHVNLSDAAKRYVLGSEKAVGAEERLGLFNAGVDFASLNRVRRAASYIDRYVRDGSLFNDQMADELGEILGNDQDALTMFGHILFEKSRDTAGERKGVGEAPRIEEEVYEQQGGVERALARAGEYMARATAAIPAAKSGAWNNFHRSMETYRQNLKNTGKEEMNPFEADRLREHFRKQGLNSEEIARRIADIQFEREKKKESRIGIESMMAAALEGGEEEYFKNTSFLNRTSYKLGGLVGDWVPMAVPYAGWHLMFGSAAQRSRMEGANLGLDSETRELRSLFRGASAATVEKIAFGGLGKMVPGFSKIQQWAGRGRPASWRARFASSPKAQMAGHAVMGMTEEAFLEPTAEYIMNSATDLFLNDEGGKAVFSGYLQDMQSMLEPDQFAALALFSAGMSSLNYGQLSRDSAQFRDMLAAYKASGGTEAGLLDAVKQPDRKSMLQRATENLHRELVEDPQGAMEQAKEAGREMLSGERIESLRELDAWRAAEMAGMVPRVEPAEQDGMFRVYAPSAEKVHPKAQREDSTAAGQQPESNQPSYTLMDGEQMTAYLQAFVSEQVENDILYTQNMLAGDVTVNQALAQKRFDAAEVITRTEADEQTGAERVVIAPETLGQMKARADMAMAAIRALEAEGVSYEEAAARMDTSLSEHIPLGTLVQTWDEAQERIRTEQARNPEFKVPAMDAPFSRAYVTNVRRGDTFRRVLRYARGSATVEDLMEETMEQAVISWQAEQHTTWGEFGIMLQEAQKSINDLFPEARGKDMQFIHLDAGKPVTGHDAIEAFSKIGRSRWLADALNHPSLPSWLRKLLNHLVKFLGAFKARVELGEMVRQAEEQGVFTLPVRQALAVMLDAGNALYRDQQGDLISLTMERAKAQAELDAALGRGVATEQEAVEEQLAERNAADEPGPVDRAQEEADDANAQQARRERTEAEVEMLGERDDDGVFNGGVSIRIEDGVRQGFIDKDRLTLCPDVPQFKQGADEKTGVVNRIVGAWQRNAAPISVWRRTDGSLQVISGRHRLDACTDADINCTVYDEGDRFNLDWARRHDVENNIRDGQASAFEIARYVRDSSLSMAEAVERGIARKGASLKGVELGLYASQELLDALGNGLVSPDDAYRVALAFRNDAEVQRSGLAVLLDGGSWQEAYNTMAAKANLEAIARQNAANGMDMGMDLFGNTDNEELYKRIGKYAAEKYRELGKELTAINGASRNPKVARKYGVNVNDAAAVQQVVKRLQEERARWKNFAVHPDLLKEANDAVMAEMGLKIREEVDRENGVLPLDEPEDSSTGDLFGENQWSLGELTGERVEELSSAIMKQIGVESSTHLSELVVGALIQLGKMAADERGGWMAERITAARTQLEEVKGQNRPSRDLVSHLENSVRAFELIAEKVHTITAGNDLRMFAEDVSRMLDDFMNRGNTHFSLAGENEALLAPNGKPSNLAPEQYRQVRTPEFKKWFGDWEKVATFKDAYERIMTMPPVTALTGQEFQKDGVPLTEKVTKLWKEQFNGIAISPELGKVRLDLEGVKSSIGHGIGSLKSAAFACVEDVIRNGIVFDRQENWKGRGYDTAVIAAPVTIKDLEYICEVVVEQRSNRQGFYLHEVEIKKKLEDVFKTSTEGGTPQASRSILALRAEDVKREEENVSKVVDENGEPKVVYHNSGKRRRVLSREFSRKSMDIESVCFAPHADPYKEYGPYEHAVFLKIVAPADYKTAYVEPGIRLGATDDAGVKIREWLQSRGYDGVIEEEDGNVFEYKVFDPTQIKSSTDNRGTYDPNNPDITFSINTKALDREYLEAVEKGDMEKAQRMVNEFAKVKGYVVDDSWKMDHRAPSKSGDTPQERQKNGEVSLLDMADGFGIIPEEMIMDSSRNLELGWDNAHMNALYAVRHAMEQRRSLVKKGNNQTPTITMYRAVPRDIKEDNFRGGDWVTPSMEYAREHGESNLDGKYRIISHRVSIKDAYWNGDDICEWGYDDGVNYAYRNTKNNRKLLDPVTYDLVEVRDENGKYEGHDLGEWDSEKKKHSWIPYRFNYEDRVIPLSKRFNFKNPDVSFSIIGEKAESFLDYHNNGLSYTDPADGKRKAIIDSRGVRLRKERMGVSEGGHVNVSLAAALDFPELFRAYPELRKLRVDFYRDSKSTTGGFTDQRENYIAVNVARGGKLAGPGLMLDTMLHEVQHVIQLHEGFALGSNGSMGKDSALAYLDASIAGLHGRDDAWARAARPRLKSMRADVASGALDPAMIYFLSHGEQEARLAGRFSENGTGVVMSGLNGFRLLDKPAFSIPLTGNITELGGITFGGGRFGRLADRILSPNGDWLYDEMVFKMRAATQRAVTKLDLYHAGNREAGLEMIAECQELISTVDRYLPNTYGFGLEPYKIWLNVFSLLYGGARRGSEVQDIVSNALAAIPMSKWPEIMEGSFIKSFVKWARNRPELEAVIEEAQTEIAERQSDYELDSSPGADNKAARAARKGVEQEVWHKLFLEYGAEFLEEYGEKKVYRLVGKFMRRVVEQIDRYRKDRTLGRIRRVVASVAPKRTPKGKPLRGKMDVAAYEKLAGYMRLLEMTGAQHEEFFRKKYPVKKDQETGEEVDPWDQVKADDMVSIVLPDDKGQPSEVTVPKLAFETYACYEKMNVERAECCARALGELISTSRDAWENARVKKQQELEAMLKPVFEAAGRTDASARGSFRTLDKLKNPVKWTLGLLDGFMNGYQYFDSLARVKPFAPIARHFADRLAVAEANVSSGEKEMMLARANAASEASGLTDEYDLSDWVLERRKKRDTGIVITEQEPDWAAQARQKYRDGLVGLVRRKVRKHGTDKVMAQAVALIRMDERMKSELDLLWPASGGWEFDRERDAVVFTEGELKRYGNQQEYVREHAEQERGRSKYAREGYVPRSMPLDALSRMEAAYLILLHEQADYTDAMRLLGFMPEVMDQLRDFAGEDVITFSYALRDVLNKRSQDVKNAMERKTGTPFPLVDHYFRAFFDVGFQSVEKTILDAASYGEAAGGGKFGMTYARKKNRLRLDLNMDVCSAFDAAMREQTLFLHMSEVSNDLRRLLSYRGEEGDAAAGLEKLLGRDALSKLKAWSDAMDRAGAETVIGHLHANRLINAVSSAAARTLLPGRVGTWIKQWTGILNTLHSSDAMDASDWLGSMKRAATGRLVMSVKEMKKQPELSSRYKGMSALNEAMNADGAGRHVSRLGKANRRAMEDIERRDMQANAISCAVLYDAMYRKVQREEPDAGKEKWHEAAMMEVRRSLSSKGQPMVLTQRSLNAQTRQWMTVGMFFLGGESINTFAKCLDLFRRGDMKHVGRGAAVWVAHGLLVALMDGLLHWFTDDEKKRKRRSAWDLLYYTIAGPLAGIPIVSGLLGDGLESLGRAAGLNVWNPKDSSLIPLSNWSDVSRAGKRVARVFDGKPHDWTDYPLAFADALRIAAAGSIAFNARSSRAGAAVEGAALTTAAFVNLMEFALKTVRSVQENGTDWDKWAGNRK